MTDYYVSYRPRDKGDC